MAAFSWAGDVKPLYHCRAYASIYLHLSYLHSPKLVMEDLICRRWGEYYNLFFTRSVTDSSQTQDSRYSGFRTRRDSCAISHDSDLWLAVIVGRLAVREG